MSIYNVKAIYDTICNLRNTCYLKFVMQKSISSTKDLYRPSVIGDITFKVLKGSILRRNFYTLLHFHTLYFERYKYKLL